MTTDLTRATKSPEALAKLAEMAVATCHSKRTRQEYSRYLRKFLASGYYLNRQGVAGWIHSYSMRGIGAPSMNAALAAINKLVDEAVIQGAMSDWEALPIRRIKSRRHPQSAIGNWIPIADVPRLLAAPFARGPSYKAIRDSAMLALFLGCGLRREELISLRWSQYQMRDGRMLLVDVIGKGEKLRTLPVPDWAVECVDRWYDLDGSGVIWSDNQDQRMIPMGASTVASRVTMYAKRLHMKFTCHDLRRSLAKFMRKAGVPLEQITEQLGHSDIKVTDRYLGRCIELSPGKAGVDQIKLEVA